MLSRNQNSLFYGVDRTTILLYVIMVLFGWLNIYAAVYNEAHSSIFDLSQKYGKQLPAIRQALQATIDQAPPQQVLVLEAIRLIEGGWDRQCDSIWVTTCPAALQVARLMQSRGLSRAEAETRVQAQNPQADKLARADVIIDTSSGIDDTNRQTTDAWSKVIAKSS